MRDKIMTPFSTKKIIDSTLREGEQQTGIVFNYRHKIEIIEHLVQLRIEEIEIGIASSRSPELLSLIPQAVSIAENQSSIALWCRCREKDIEFANRCSPDMLSLSMPVSDILIHEKLAKNREWVLEKLGSSVHRAAQLGFESISVGLEDATRAAPDFLLDVAKLVDNSAACRLRLADTLGIASPGDISELVRSVQDTVTIPVGLHTHNDFGMATANAIAALDAGAQWTDATVLGIGERTGNCRLEEIVGYLALQKGVERYDVNALKTLCDIVADASNICIQPHHPVIGEQIFTCESGLHVHALAVNPKTYEPYDPWRLGRDRTLLFGSKTGKRAVQLALHSAGMLTTNELVENLVEEIRQHTRSGAKPLAQKELIHLARQRIRST